MNESDMFIPPTINFINPISKQFTINRRFTSSIIFVFGLYASCLDLHSHITAQKPMYLPYIKYLTKTDQTCAMSYKQEDSENDLLT